MKTTAFVDDLIAQDKIQEHLGHLGKMIAGSKSMYRKKYPLHFVLFNGNICVEFTEDEKILGFIPAKTTSVRKVWWGDIDITDSRNVLKTIAKELGKTIYILHELDARFGNDTNPLWKNYAIKITPDGDEYIGEVYQPYIFIDDEVLQLLITR